MKAWHHVLILLVVTAAHWAPRLQGPIDLRYDAGVYYILGTSLAEGKGYRLLSEPGEIEGIQYPPLLPAWVAAHQVILGTDDPLTVGQALRITSALLSLLLAVAVYALARRILPPGWALFASLASILYFHTIYLEDLCFAEVPFSVVSLGFLLASGSDRPRVRALAYPLAAAAFFLRTAGIALLGAWVLSPLTRREWWKVGQRGALAAVCFFAWQGHVSSVQSAPEYDRPAYPYQRAPYQHYNVTYGENIALKDPFRPEEGRITVGTLASRAILQSPELILGIGEGASAPKGFYEWPLMRLNRNLGWDLPLWPALGPLVLLAIATCAGVGLLWLDGHRLPCLFILCSLAIIVITPWPAQFSRYLAPLSPLLAIALALALSRLWGKKRWAAILLAVIVPVTQLTALRLTFTRWRDTIRYERPDGSEVQGGMFVFDEARLWKPFYESLWWIRDNTPPDAIVISSCPHLVYLHANRTAVMPPLIIDTEEARRLIDAVPGDYVIVDRLDFVDVSRRYAAPVVESDPDTWEPVHEDPGGKLIVYGRKR